MKCRYHLPIVRILALLVVILGSVARTVRWLADKPLWLDEQMIAINIRDRGFAGLASDLAHDQSAPIGWLWLERLVYLMLGDSGLALRLIPLLFGVGTLVLAYWAGRRLLGPAGTLVLVSLLAVNGSLMRYSTELKQYSADAFTVLLLLVVAIAAVRHPASGRRALAFWGAAAVSGLFSTAAIMVMPGLALVVVAVGLFNGGFAATLRRHAAGAGLWVVALGVHYVLALRFAIGDDTLAALNARLGFPPAGTMPTVRWLIARPLVLAGDPIGVPKSLAVAVWLLAAVGAIVALWLPRRARAAAARPATAGATAASDGDAIGGPVTARESATAATATVGEPDVAGKPATARDAETAGSGGPRRGGWSVSGLPWAAGPRWALGLILLAPPVTAFAAAAVHAVPLYGRFAVQLLPPLFLAIGIATDLIAAVLIAAGRSPAGLRRPRAAVRTLGAVTGAAVLAAIAVLAVAPAAVTAARPAPLTNGVDDRAAAAGIAAARREGDLLVVTPSAWPGVKWYAGADAFQPVYVLHTGCNVSNTAPLTGVVAGHPRILVYAGMQSGGTPHEAKIAAALTGFGTVTGPEKFGTGALYIVTVAAPAPSASIVDDTFCLMVQKPS